MMIKTVTRHLAAGCLLAGFATHAATNLTVVNPERVGLLPRTATFDVNANTNFNYNAGNVTKWLDITAGGNVAVCWSDAGPTATDFKSMNSVWTLFDSSGVNLIPPTVITNRSGANGASMLTNNWLAFFRPDGSSTPGNAGATPRIRANRFGDGFLFGARADRLGLEDPALLALNSDNSTGGNPLTVLSVNSGFSAVQLINNNGTPGAGIVTGVSDAEAQATGNVWCHGMEVLANGNIVIVSESRQDQELVDRFGGTTPNRHVIYRVVSPTGAVVKQTSLASETTDRTELFGVGVGVTSNGFALRFSYRPRHDGSGRTSGTIRLFDNDGNPLSGDINMSDAVGAFLGVGPNYPTGGNGGRGDSVGFHGNGTDAYVNACIGDQEGVFGPVYLTVYNADGSVRYHRPVADAGETNYAEQVDAAIAPDGRVVVVMDDRRAAGITGRTNRLILGRLFDKNGEPLGPHFFVSERETPFTATKDALRPKVAWRDNLIAVAWGSSNSPAAPSVVSARIFDVARVVAPEHAGLAPRSPTIYVNANTNFNYNNLSGPFVDITTDHKAAICWTDPSATATDFKSMGTVWTLFDAAGNNLLPPAVITNRTGAVGASTLTNNWFAFFRPDGTPTAGNQGGSPKIRANRFGPGFMFAARADRLGLEVPALLAINADNSAGGNPITPLSTASGFPAVQLLNDDGTPAGLVTGTDDTEAQATGAVWCHGIERLANGNIVIVMESRQDQDMIDRFGGTTANRHATYKVVSPSGAVVKPYSLVSETTDRTELFGFGVGVTSNGFAIRFSYRPRHDGAGRLSGTIRLFDNNGNPTSGDINLADTVGAFMNGGSPGIDQNAGCGGRGDSVGFHGNGVDAYVNVCIGAQETARGPVYVTVYNADGTVRWHRPVADPGETNHCEQVDGAIAPDGRVLVAIDDHYASATRNTRLILGKMFDATGKSLTPLFYVSELELPHLTTKDSQRPRMAWRDDAIAYVWRSLSGTTTTNQVLGFRMFSDVAAAPPVLTIAKAGGNAVLTWPASAAGYTLRSRDSLTSGNWETNSPAPVFSSAGSLYQVTEPLGPATRYYQLVK